MSMAVTAICTVSRRRARRRPVEKKAHPLPKNHFLRHPIPGRIRVPPDSEPKDLLQQLDSLPNWEALKVEYPVFLNYPPNLPRIDDDPGTDPRPVFTIGENAAVEWLDDELLRTVFTTGENAALEWLGDAVIGAAQALCIHRSTSAYHSQALRDCAIVDILISKGFLAHLALLYGLQLYDYLTPEAAGHRMPSMERTSDIFESYVGAAAVHFGFVKTIEWVERLFSPWVAKLCGTGDIRSAKPRKSARARYDAWKHKVPGASAMQLDPLVVEFPTGATNQVALPVASNQDVRTLLATALPRWTDDVDLSAIPLPVSYPPPPPAVNAAYLQPLTDAMTDILCRIYFGADVGCNDNYSVVGQRLYWLAVTKLALDRLPTATPAELNDVRLECTSEELMSRLALVLNLHRHLRVLRRVDEDAPWVDRSQCNEAFCSLVAVIYLHVDWDVLLQWLDALLTPWLLAAANGTLRVSLAAEHQRQFRLKQQLQNQLQNQLLEMGTLGTNPETEHRDVVTATHSTARERYSPVVPKSRRAGKKIRSRVRGRPGLFAECEHGVTAEARSQGV
ncbi:hypothetical protein C8R44DRAFT_878554 [Mycena epipterygia]|nr:hypothetical protein C8R44DRAFT_878554 [Mycena epipterygia]